MITNRFGMVVTLLSHILGGHTKVAEAFIRHYQATLGSSHRKLSNQIFPPKAQVVVTMSSLSAKAGKL
jgi:hypothetical protein